MAQKQAPHPRRKGSVVWATVLSWLSSLLLALLALCLVLMTTICSASYMKEQVNRSDFSEAATAICMTTSSATAHRPASPPT